MPQFVHLRVHSEYSISDGMVRLEPMIQAAAKDQQGAIALTDLSNLFGLVKFYKEARGGGVKPIAGCDVWVSSGDGSAAADRVSRLLLLVMNAQGYLRLCEILSRAWLENQSRGRPEIDAAWLEDGGSEGLIALSGGQGGDIGLALAGGQPELAERCARRWARLFPQRFYIEIQRYGQVGSEPYIAQATRLAARLELPVVATHPVQFLVATEYRAHEARVCIADGEILANPRRVRRFTAEQYFKSQREMAEIFADLPAALENSVEIAKRCNLTLELDRARLPQFPTPNGVTLDAFLKQEAARGLVQRLDQLYPNAELRAQNRQRYEERLQFETQTIVKMGFPVTS